MTIDIQCPTCGELNPASQDNAGTRLDCRSCGQSFTVSMAFDDTTRPLLEMPADDELPESVGPYEIRRSLGAGAMGRVYLAYDPNLDREVAVKVLTPALAADKDGRMRFLREAKSAARVQHTHVAQVYLAGLADDLAFIAMEFVPGRSLDKVIATDGPMPWREATQVVRDAAAGLQAAHNTGLVHRDVKPANLIRTPEGITKILDFGLVRTDRDVTQITKPGTLLGTPAYLSPEQWAGGVADARSDLYALTCTYYYLLTGRAPFQARSLPEMGYQHQHETFPDPRNLVPELSDRICRLLRRGAAKDPAERFQDAGKMISYLDRLLAAPDSTQNFGLSPEQVSDPASTQRLPQSDSDSSGAADLPTQWLGQSQPDALASMGPTGRWRRRFVAGGAAAFLLLLAVIVTISTKHGKSKIKLKDPNGTVHIAFEDQEQMLGDQDVPPDPPLVQLPKTVPILRFDFEGDAQNTGSLGGSHNGTLYGNGYFSSDGVIGSRSYDPGTSGFIILPATQLGDRVTLAAWTKLDDGVENIQTILSSKTYQRGGFSWGLNSWVRSDRLMLLETWSQAGEISGVRSPSNSVSYGQWHHVAVTLDRESGEVTMYVDGDVVRQADSGFATDFTDDQPMSIGRYFEVISRTTSGRLVRVSVPFHFTGLIDDLRVYDEVLSEQEVVELAQRP